MGKEVEEAGETRSDLSRKSRAREIGWNNLLYTIISKNYIYTFEKLSNIQCFLNFFAILHILKIFAKILCNQNQQVVAPSFLLYSKGDFGCILVAGVIDPHKLHLLNRIAEKLYFCKKKKVFLEKEVFLQFFLKIIVFLKNILEFGYFSKKPFFM